MDKEEIQKIIDELNEKQNETGLLFKRFIFQKGLVRKNTPGEVKNTPDVFQEQTFWNLIPS